MLFQPHVHHNVQSEVHEYICVCVCVCVCVRIEGVNIHSFYDIMLTVPESVE